MDRVVQAAMDSVTSLFGMSELAIMADSGPMSERGLDYVCWLSRRCATPHATIATDLDIECVRVYLGVESVEALRRDPMLEALTDLQLSVLRDRVVDQESYPQVEMPCG